jgi:hypothetical protein
MSLFVTLEKKMSQENLWILLKPTFRSRKLRLTTVGDPPRWPRDTPQSTEVDTKFRRQVAVDQLV